MVYKGSRNAIHREFIINKKWRKIMRRKFSKRVKASLVAGAMAVSVCFSQIGELSASAAENTVLGDIATILNDYQLFIDDDITGSGHIMGGIVDGGELSLDACFGDVAKEANYIYEYTKGNLGTASFNVSYDINKDVYYSVTSSDDVSVNDAWIVQEGIDEEVDNAFTSICAESASLANGAVLLTDDDEDGKIVIDCTGDEHVNVEIPYEAWSSSSIEIKVDDVEWFKTHLCVVSVTGVEDNVLSMYGWSVTANINGSSTGIQGLLKNMTGTDDAQLNETGMNLVWNFPDATGTVNLSCHTGHVVAPLANVTVSASYEGSLIAKSLESSAEAHFYPMSLRFDGTEITEEETTTEETTTEETTTEETTTEETTTEETTTEETTTEETTTEEEEITTTFPLAGPEPTTTPEEETTTEVETTTEETTEETTTVEETTTPEETTTEEEEVSFEVPYSGSNPETGDSSNAVPYIVLVLFGAAAIFVTRKSATKTNE